MSTPIAYVLVVACLLFFTAGVPAAAAQTVTAFVREAAAAAGSPDASGAPATAAPRWLCDMRPGVVAGGAAWGTYNDTIPTDGWSTLEVWTDPAAGPGAEPAAVLRTAFAVGCVEGWLTQHRIFQMWTNAMHNMFPDNKLPVAAEAYLAAQVATMRANIAKYYPSQPAEGGGGAGGRRPAQSAAGPYWRGMAVVMAHADGLAAAYNASHPAGQEMSALELYAVSSADDLETLSALEGAAAAGDPAARAAYSDLAAALDFDPDRALRAASRRGPWGLRRSRTGPRQPMNTDGSRRAVGGEVPSIDLSDCSAFVKLLGQGARRASGGTTNDTDPVPTVVAAHATWANFWEQLRVFKIFHLSYTPAGTVSFSSYPGFLSSGDDWYVAAGSQMAVTETTNNLYNSSLYFHLDPFAAFTWQRALAATWYGTGPEDWSSLFATQNSGTYNCQWIVVRLNGTSPSTGTSDYLWILEQIPGFIEKADMTPHLVQHRYWASYNIPFFTEVYNRSGYNVMYDKHGDAYSYSECPRAQIFRRNITAVVDVEAAKRLIRYNNYKVDPLSHGNPMDAVASRGDLLPEPIGFGAYDAKVVSDLSLTDLTGAGPSMLVHAISGPTHQQLSPFSWTESGLGAISHVGQPETFAFGWEHMQPAGAAAAADSA